MRRSVIFHAFAIAFALAALPIRLPGQVGANPEFAIAPPGMAEAPQMVLSQYLMRREDVTRTRPIVRLCGPNAVAVMTPEYISHLTRANLRSVDSVEVIASCPPRDSTSPWTWSPAFLPDADLVMILQMSTGPLSSVIDGLVGLTPTGEGGPPRSWRERFEWDHQRGLGGMYLRFTDFESPLPPDYRFPPAPPGSYASPESVLGQFLWRRWEVTRMTPVVQLCGPQALAMMTPAFEAQFTRGPHRVAERFVVDSVCRSPSSVRSGGAAVRPLIVTSMSFGRLHSSIEIVGPGRMERFESHHDPNGQGMVLTFSSFSRFFPAD